MTGCYGKGLQKKRCSMHSHIELVINLKIQDPAYLARSCAIHNDQCASTYIVAVAIPKSSTSAKGGDIGAARRNAPHRTKILIATIIIGEHFPIISPHISNFIVSPPYVLRVTTTVPANQALR